MKYNTETNEFTFTRKERYKIYSLLLKYINPDKTHTYLCVLVKKAISDLFGTYYFLQMDMIDINYRLKSLPELYKYKIDREDKVWFKNNDERIAALKQCKKLTR